MIKVGLTGNIGSGKSTAAKIFSNLGVPVFYADDEAKKLYHNPDFLKKLTALFGEEIINKNGLNRQALANIVFNDQSKLEQLNNLVHPEVRNVFEKWLEKHMDKPYVIQEAAILFESGFYKMFDKIVLVTADQESRIKRVKKRDQLSREDILARMSKQESEESKKGRSHFVVNNNDDHLMLPQILKIHKSLSK